MHPFTAGLAIATPELRDAVQASLQHFPVRIAFDVHSLTEAVKLAPRMDEFGLDIVFADMKDGRAQFPQLMACLEGSQTRPAVMALNATADPEVILCAMRNGANEFLIPPLGESMPAAVNKCLLDRRKRHLKSVSGRVVGFLSAKGGCGATTLACHVAAEMQRFSTHQVLLADLDLHAGMVGFFMKSQSRYTVGDAFSNLSRLDDSYWQALVSSVTPNLEIINAPDPSHTRSLPDAESLRTMFRFLRGRYDWSLVDLGRGLHYHSMSTLDEVDEACLVTALDLPALHRAKQILQKLLDCGYSRSRLRLILNRTPRKAEITPLEIEQMFGCPVYAMIPEDSEALYEACAEGKLAAPASRFARHTARLARKLAGMPEAKERGRFGIFG